MRLEPPIAQDLSLFTSTCCLVGHTHLPLVCTARAGENASLRIRRPSADERITAGPDRLIVNIGSVGTSFVDPQLASYLLIDDPGNGAAPTLTFRSVPYPTDQFMSKLRSSSAPPELVLDRQRQFSEPSPIALRALEAHRQWYGDLIPVS
jgi:hypothetical protein